jgi:hypothetical protein
MPHCSVPPHPVWRAAAAERPEWPALRRPASRGGSPCQAESAAQGRRRARHGMCCVLAAAIPGMVLTRPRFPGLPGAGPETRSRNTAAIAYYDQVSTRPPSHCRFGALEGGAATGRRAERLYLVRQHEGACPVTRNPLCRGAAFPPSRQLGGRPSGHLRIPGRRGREGERPGAPCRGREGERPGAPCRGREGEAPGRAVPGAGRRTAPHAGRRRLPRQVRVTKRAPSSAE